LAKDFSYRIVSLKPNNLMWGTFYGEISVRGIAEAYSAYQEHPDFGPGVDELLDFSQASVANLRAKSFEIFRSFMSEQPERHHSMSAIVVNTALEYGLSRMMGGMLDQDVPVERGVFYSVEDAVAWLRPEQVDDVLAAHQKAIAAD
jgi:hypothetical protein